LLSLLVNKVVCMCNGLWPQSNTINMPYTHRTNVEGIHIVQLKPRPHGPPVAENGNYSRQYGRGLTSNSISRSPITGLKNCFEKT